MRPIRPDDKSALSRAFEHLSEESRYRRFLAPIKRLTGSDLAYLTELDHHGHGIGTQMLPRLARRARERGAGRETGGVAISPAQASTTPSGSIYVAAPESVG